MTKLHAGPREPLPELDWIAITPSVIADAAARRALRRCAKRLIDVGNNGTAALTVATIRAQETALAREQDIAIALELVLCINVLCDLQAQGWQLRVDRGGIAALPPVRRAGMLADDKADIRARHLVERDAQLCQAPTRRFVREMERRRLFRGQWHSVFSLMRDGRELAAQLCRALEVPAGAERNQLLRATIDPYVQVIMHDAVCEQTGLRLGDVWRYFRHTWSTTYQSTPGRKIFFLVRDRAAPNHPVIGVGSLGSAIVRLHVRDEWIGWTGSDFIDQLRAHPSVGWARWLDSWLRTLIKDVYLDDFIEQNVLTRAELAQPSASTIKRLARIAVDERRVHRLYPARGQHKSTSGTRAEPDWQRQAKTHLFRSKRAGTLAELLDARRRLLEVGFTSPTRSSLRRALDNREAVRAVQTVLRHVKAAHVGVNMMDITVCGAVAPYNLLLGGKLVSLLMASPDVTAAYNARYRSASSVIASSMAGRKVQRSPQLVLLGTTSLYGVGSSQYNRLRIPAEAIGGSTKRELAFIPLGKTVGYGSYHFSGETMRAIEPVLRQLQHGRPVNSIFGEGVNPKLRKVRSALDAVELPSDLLLQHGSPRLVYAVPLATNFRDVLLGRARRARYILPPSPTTTARIVDFWCTRWLARRVESPGVIDAVAKESLVNPVRHGARVVLPEVPEEVGPLFSTAKSAAEYAAPLADVRASEIRAGTRLQPERRKQRT